jgi:hypothetical protein
MFTAVWDFVLYLITRSLVHWETTDVGKIVRRVDQSTINKAFMLCLPDEA